MGISWSRKLFFFLHFNEFPSLQKVRPTVIRIESLKEVFIKTPTAPKYRTL